MTKVVEWWLYIECRVTATRREIEGDEREERWSERERVKGEEVVKRES